MALKKAIFTLGISESKNENFVPTLIGSLRGGDCEPLKLHSPCHVHDIQVIGTWRGSSSLLEIVNEVKLNIALD